MFWSSADLTGNQTTDTVIAAQLEFWSSADVTGNQTQGSWVGDRGRFGSVEKDAPIVCQAMILGLWRAP